MNQNENRYNYYPHSTHGRGYNIAMSLLWCAVYIGIFILFQFLTSIIFSFGASFKVTFSAILNGNAMTDSDIKALQDALTDGLLRASNSVSIISALCTLATVLLITDLRTRDIPRALEIRKINPVSIPILIVFAIGLSMAVSLFLSAIPFPDSWKGSYDDGISTISEGNAIVAFISTVIVAPIIEEVVFRALAYKMLRRSLPKIAAMTIVSAVFGALHGTIIWFLYAFVIGMLLCWLFERYHSILANIIVHMTFNLIGSNADLLDKVNPVVLNALCIFFVLALVPCTVYIIRTTKKPDFISVPPLDVDDEYSPHDDDDKEEFFGGNRDDGNNHGNNDRNNGNGASPDLLDFFR